MLALFRWFKLIAKYAVDVDNIEIGGSIQQQAVQCQWQINTFAVNDDDGGGICYCIYYMQHAIVRFDSDKHSRTFGK